MIARVVILLIRHWPAFARYMVAYTATVRSTQLRELRAEIGEIEHAGFVRGVATCKRALLPEQEVNDA